MKIWSTMALEMGVMAVIVMSCSVLQGVQAQVDCLQVEGSGASVSDANSLVQYLRQITSSFCANSEPGICWFIGYPQWDAAAVMCMPPNTCIQYDVLGDYLNQILAQCIQQNDLVQGYITVSADTVYYLNDKTCRPKCFAPPA